MNPAPTSARALIKTRAPTIICNTCQRSILAQQQKRNSSAAAAAEAKFEEQDIAQPLNSSKDKSPLATVPVTGPKPYYTLNCSIVLSRPPVITRDLHPFESAYYLYQRRLNERTALPFSRYFYYRKGTPADLEWRRKQKERITPARDIGKYDAYGKHGWHDELLVGAAESDREHQVDSLLTDAETSLEQQDEGNEGGSKGQLQLRRKIEIERPQNRVTEADEKDDLRSLNRLLPRCLYLVVKRQDGKWGFPTSPLEGREWLNKAAERIIYQTGGVNMNTWVVGNVPIGHYVEDYYRPIEDTQNRSIQLGNKTFFMKGRIMAGQASLNNNQFGLTEFRWLAKEEIQQLVSPKYWSMTENMLTER